MTTPDNQRHPRGGLYLEDFEVGRVFQHRLTRTVTQMDNVLFCSITMNPQPLHIDAHFCSTETEWGRPLINSFFTLGLMMGISVYDTTVGTTIANLGMETRFHTPLFEGDTIRVETEIVAKREQTCPRIAHRARSGVEAGRPRFEASRQTRTRQAEDASPRFRGDVYGLIESLVATADRRSIGQSRTPRGMRDGLRRRLDRRRSAGQMTC